MSSDTLTDTRCLFLPKICCAFCNLQFSVKDFTVKHSKCPILLQCGHSMCEPCVSQNLKAVNDFSCKYCGFVFPSEFNEHSNDYLPINLYILGYLTALQNYEKNKKLSFLNSNVANFDYAIKEETSRVVGIDACEECSTVASWYCDNCKSNFCEICWEKVHTSARSLMKHTKILISSKENLQNAVKKCPAHESQNLEFYCKGCCVAVCSHCVILHHQGEGHCPVTLKDQNMEMTLKIKMAAEEAEIIRKRMIQTLQKIKLSLCSEAVENCQFSELEAAITNNFFRLHGILQLEEEKLIKKLREVADERGIRLQHLSRQLSSQIENITGLLRECDILTNRPMVGDFTRLHERLMEVKNLPCYLISQKDDQKEVKITFDDKLADSIRSYCTLEFPSNEIFELRSGADLPKDYIVDPLRTFVDCSQCEGYNAETGTDHNDSELESLSNSSSRSVSKTDPIVDSSKKESLARFDSKKKPFHESRIYSVRVTYIKNPGEFYVTLSSQWSKQRAIEKKASHLASASPFAFPETVSKGEIYLVRYKADGKWYRGRVVEVIPTCSGSDQCVVVYYLDYGNSEEVSTKRLRFVSHELLEEEPMAIKCKLFDCIPKNGEWSPESTKIMGTMLENSTVTMFVMKVLPDCLEVDLSKVQPRNQMGSEIISVRDALVFLEFTCLVGGHKKIWQPRRTPKYLNQIFPAVGENCECLITHANSPSDFYVQRGKTDVAFANAMSIDVQNYYGSNFQKGVLYNPVVGLPCAAIFSEDQKWYRAKIIDIPKNKLLTVSYVDYGNVKTVPWNFVKKLKDNFMKRPPLAFHCTLAGIRPKDSDTWNSQAVSFMKKLVQQKGCRIKVRAKSKTSSKLEVLLYKNVEGKETCVNFSLVDYDLASRTEDLIEESFEVRKINDSTPTFSFLNEKSAKNSRDDLSSISSFDKSNLSSNGKKNSKLKWRELRERRDFNNDVGTTSEEDEGNVPLCDDLSFKTKVEVLSAASPSEIFVTFPALKDVLAILESKLREFYDNFKDEDEVKWTEGAKCAVYSSVKSGWYRATVLEVLADEKVKVFLKDVALVSTEPTSSLRELDQSFLKYATCAVECHLSGIRPVGDLWPSISCEFLVSELETYKEVYMTRKGEIEHKSLPVELWVQKVEPGSALEPTVKEWVTLNRLLVDQGLAIPDMPKMLYSCFSDERESFCEDSELGPEKIKKKEEKIGWRNEESTEASTEAATYVPSLSFHWLPPPPTNRAHFIGIPTYVDFDASIFIHDIDKEEELKRIRESLVEEYEHSKPSPDDHFWSPGQTCIVRYHVDNFWYRGLVVKTNENLTYEVLFVDYGNVETCNASEMRKRIKTAEIPILTNKFQLKGIVPRTEDGKWPESVIEFLHSAVVDKYCKVNVFQVSSDSSKASMVSLKILDKNVDAGEFLVDQGFATFENIPLDSSKDFEARVSKKLGGCQKYVPLQVPVNCCGFFIETTTVVSETEFYGNIVDDEFLPANLRQILNNFEFLREKLTIHCSEQPPLNEFKKGQACCCLFSENQKWYRAEIETVKEEDKSVCVFYVDYGNKEFLKKESLRECAKEWLELPKMALKFKLANIERSPDVPKSAYVTALTKCLNQVHFFAEIVEKHVEVLEVNLLTRKNGPLAYQHMLDNALMRRTKEK